MPPVKLAPRRYVIEMFIVMSVYVGLITGRPYLLSQTHQPLLEHAIEISPALPIWVVFFVVVRYYRRIDEFQQRQLLETLALCFGLAAAFLASYSFFEDAGAPHLSTVWVWPIMGVIWAVTGMFQRLRTR